jgi:hypothetical protein
LVDIDAEIFNKNGTQQHIIFLNCFYSLYFLIF